MPRLGTLNSVHKPIVARIGLTLYSPASNQLESMKTNTMNSADILAYYRQICTEMFTVVDLETTGGIGNRDRIIEISVLQATLKGGIQNLSTDLIDPQIRIPSQIVKLTGISQDMVEPAETSDLILPNYLPVLRSGVLTAHNLSFDYSFLQAEYRRLGVDFKAKAQLCTVELSRLLLSDLPSRSLPNLVRHFGFDVGQSHRAESDAIACWMLLERLLRQLETLSDRQILDLIGNQWLTTHDIAAILWLPLPQAEALLSEEKVKSRFSHHRQIRLYQRSSLEELERKFKRENQKLIIEQLSLPL
jgi:DNA polymerase III subunit epsilon